MTTSLRIAGLSLLVLLAACSSAPAPRDSGGTPTDTGGTVDSGGGTDTGGGGTDSIVVQLYDEDDAPLAGATVALENPSGTRTEMTSGADGRVTFGGLSWAAGPYDVVAYASGRVAQAVVDMTETHYGAHVQAGALPMYLSNNTPAAMVTVSGTISGGDPTHQFIVVPTIAGQISQHAGTAYSAMVRSGMPYRLVVAEFSAVTMGSDTMQTFQHWALTAEQPAASADVTLDVDLVADAVTPHTATGNFPIPTHTTGSFFDLASPYGYVFNAGGRNPFMGFPTSATVTTDRSRVDYAFEWIDVPGVTAIGTFYELIQGSTISGAIERAVPADGAQTFDLFEPPVVREPAGGAFPHVFDTVVLTNPQPTAEPIAVFATTDRTLYAVRGVAGANHFAIPALPTGADPSAIFVGDLTRQITLCEPTGPTSDDVCGLYATAGEAPVDP